MLDGELTIPGNALGWSLARKMEVRLSDIARKTSSRGALVEIGDS